MCTVPCTQWRRTQSAAVPPVEKRHDRKTGGALCSAGVGSLQGPGEPCGFPQQVLSADLPRFLRTGSDRRYWD